MARPDRDVTDNTPRPQDLDPVTQQIVANALSSIAEEMALTIFRTARSTVVRDAMDFSSAVCTAKGETIAQAITVPFHLGSVPAAMEALLGHYGNQLHQGDVFIMNDPFDGGMHIPDVFITKPVYLADELIGFTVATAHHGDMGGRLPGSAACDNTEIFQEGLRLPWLRLYAAGVPVEDVFKIIRANVRIPEQTMGDIGAQVAACTVAERELQQLARRYGTRRLAGITDELINYTERLVRQEIASWPDGEASFTDFIDFDGVDTYDIPITVRLRISGDEVTADFSDSAPMVTGALNSTRSFVQAAVYQAIRAALTVEVPNTAGAFRPINVITRPGTITEVVMPAASSMRGVTGFRVFDAINGALAQLLPHRVPAAGEGGNSLAIFGGERSNGRPFVFFELVCGTWGGTPVSDGNDGVSNPSAQAANIPIEVAESEYPIVVERYGLVADTGGAGRHRGGLAIERMWRCLAPEAMLIVRSDRKAHRPYGLNGGLSGAPSASLLKTGTDGIAELPTMFSKPITNEQRFYHRTAGGGGWGDPLTRDPEAVAADVKNEKLSRHAARHSYGVVIGPNGAVDQASTSALRASRFSRPASEEDVG